MAEIKSTLDLVMERTRNLTLTEEEKREQALSEFRDNLKGLLQKYQDKILTVEQFKRELHSLKESSTASDNTTVIRLIAGRLDPDRDNHMLLTLLSDVCSLDVHGIISILEDYRRHLESAAHDIMAGMVKALSTKGISGTAVVPNLDASPEWPKAQIEGRKRFEAMLDREIRRLSSIT